MSSITELAPSRWADIPAAASVGRSALGGPAPDVSYPSCRQAGRSRRGVLALSLLVSAAFHALLLFAFNRPEAPQPTGIRETAAMPIVPLAFELPPEETPPPLETAERIEEEADRAADGIGAASLPEPISTVAVADIAIVIGPTIPIRPLATAAQWAVPTSQLRASTKTTDRIFKVSELDRRPALIASVEPIFPPELATTTAEGVVVVRFVVTSRGAIEAVSVVSSPHPAFGAAVTKALSRWQFRAGMKNGRAVNTEMELPVRFNLPNT